MSPVECAETIGRTPEIRLLRETRPEEIAQRTNGTLTYGKRGRFPWSKTPWAIEYPDAEILWGGHPKKLKGVDEAVPYLIDKQGEITLLPSAIVLFSDQVLIVDPGPDKPTPYGDPNIITGYSISTDGKMEKFKIPAKKADRVLLQARDLTRSNNPYSHS